MKDFQKTLQDALAKLAAAEVEGWQRLYSCGWRRCRRAKLDVLF